MQVLQEILNFVATLFACVFATGREDRRDEHPQAIPNGRGLGEARLRTRTSRRTPAFDEVHFTEELLEDEAS